MAEYVLMDERAHYDPDRASVYVYCKGLTEALDYRRDFPDAVLVEISGPREASTMTVVPWPKKSLRAAVRGEGKEKG